MTLWLMEYTQQAKPTSKIKMIMNFLNQFHKSKINKIKKKNLKKLQKI